MSLRHIRPAFAALAVGVGLIASGPPSASAAPFTVGSTGDGADVNPGNGICDADAGAPVVCTFRAAALEAANDPDDADSIGFNTTAMGGTQINVTGSTFADVTSNTTIDGCSANPTSAQPCVRVHGPDTSLLLMQVTGDDSTIRGLAFTRLGTPIITGVNSDRLAVGNSWFGMTLTGTATATEYVTLSIRLDGSEATIGGTSAADRNVFTNSTIGIRILGGDGNTISGNYFGTNKDGGAAATGLYSRAIEVASFDGVTDDPAIGNVIGGTVSEAAAATPACDGACNVISGVMDGSGDAFGVTLQSPFSGTLPAGQTTIAGNYIGLDSSGMLDLGNSLSGINVGDASNATVGGPTARDRNKIAWNGAPFVTTPDAGVRIGDGDSNQVLGNEIYSNLGPGIQVDGGDSNLIAGNFIGTTAAGGFAGNGDAGVILGDGSTGNLIGGNTAVDENVIENSPDAIRVSAVATSGNVIARNRGLFNAGLFIDLGIDGPGNTLGANGGALPPAIASATTGGATGTAPPGSLVRVFEATVVPAEVESFVGAATTDSSGNWCLDYDGALTVAQRVSASQTTAGGTSELTGSVASLTGAGPGCTPPAPPAGAAPSATPTRRKCAKGKRLVKRKGKRRCVRKRRRR